MHILHVKVFQLGHADELRCAIERRYMRSVERQSVTQYRPVCTLSSIRY